MAQKSELKIFESQPSKFVKKGEKLVIGGQIANEAFYVVTGCLRSYFVDGKDKEHIFMFAPEDWIISDLEFSKNKGNAFLTIDAIEDSEIKAINIHSFGQISYSDQELIEKTMNKLRNRIYSLQKRIVQLLSYSAEERYREFIKTYPSLYNRISLKMMASYLGVTPESLSRLRKELVKRK